MKNSLALARLLLATSALVIPTMASAQSAGSAAPAQTDGTDTASTPDQDAALPAAQTADQEEAPDISIPGGEIIVTGRRTANVQQAAPQVVSVLSAADIARTGEGDIAGALSHVTGLSVVGNGYVYVRGLGDRYSLALLNGLPLPSPEPLKRVVPLDIFPTEVIASSLVQKSYSPNYPGEFGGGVINLTTKAAPREGFLTVGGSIGGDTRTTGQLGYTYFGSPWDWTGFDNGQRDVPPALASFLASGKQLTEVPAEDRRVIASQLVLGRTAVVQRNNDIPVNWDANVTTGKSFDLGSATLGVIATAGYKNKWLTRDTLQEESQTLELDPTQRNSFERVITDNHIVVDGLLGLGLEFGENKLRWTNLYIRDTLKQTRLAKGTTFYDGLNRMIQDTAWYERQLIDSQLVGEFKFDPVSVDVRFGYANSQREAPYETRFSYFQVKDGPYQGLWVNPLDNQGGDASIAFSDLNEDVWYGGLDFTIEAASNFRVTTGISYTDTQRTSSRRQFNLLASRDPQYYGSTQSPGPLSVFRPDYLVQPSIVVGLSKALGITLVDVQEGDASTAAFAASLTNMAGYLQGQWDINDTLKLDFGARYETAKQTVNTIQVFNTPVSTVNRNNKIDRDYVLPAATLTWELQPQMQVRLSGSKTIARPQFRELLFQPYYDPDANRTYFGNPNLVDSQIYNAEARYEWYFARDQHIAVAGFYKRIENPIEQYLYGNENGFQASFANAPKADLYGAEIEAQKYFDLASLGGGFFAARRAVVIGNYTYTHSKVSSSASETTIDNTGAVIASTDLFLDGRPLTGQSDHVANLEVGLENTDHLSAQTFLLNYASRRLTTRGPSLQPDVYAYPGFRLDFVARQGFRLAGVNFEGKVEIRNITGTKYQEYQDNGTNRNYYNLYNVGTSGKIGLSVNF